MIKMEIFGTTALNTCATEQRNGPLASLLSPFPIVLAQLFTVFLDVLLDVLSPGF